MLLHYLAVQRILIKLFSQVKSVHNLLIIEENKTDDDQVFYLHFKLKKSLFGKCFIL